MTDKEKRGKDFYPGSMIRNAKSLQHIVKQLEQPDPEATLSNELQLMGEILAGSILLSHATEIALKAWQCRGPKGKPDRSHDLLKLFNSLEPGTQKMLEARMRKLSPDSVWADEPSMQNLNSDIQDMLGAKMHPLRDVLRSHSDANVHWRYMHERPFARFDAGEINRALDTIISAYEETWGCV